MDLRQRHTHTIKGIAEKLGFDSIGLTVKGTNIWTWVKDDGLQTDPEVAFSGQWEIYTPIIKSISVGVN